MIELGREKYKKREVFQEFRKVLRFATKLHKKHNTFYSIFIFTVIFDNNLKKSCCFIPEFSDLFMGFFRSMAGLTGWPSWRLHFEGPRGGFIFVYVGEASN